MDIRKVKKLIELIEQSDVAEIEINTSDESIRISRATMAPLVQQAVPAPVMAAPAAVEASAPVETSETVDLKDAFCSPMVGTFYASSNPQNPPFKKVGDSVKEGEILCIIEAMKIMNQIPSSKSGKIVDVLVDNAETVEFNQPLFVIK